MTEVRLAFAMSDRFRGRVTANRMTLAVRAFCGRNRVDSATSAVRPARRQRRTMQKRKWLALASVIGLISGAAIASEPAGMLVVDVLDYESNVKLKKNIRRQLDNGFLRWTVVDDELVIPLVDERFVEPEFPHATRWGERDELSLPAGDYRLTCIGYEQKELSRDPQEVLAEGAYFNLDIMTFAVRPEQTTRVEILPRFRKTGGFLLKVFVPHLHVKIYEGEELVGEKVVSVRSDESIRWDEYTGPLKREPR